MPRALNETSLPALVGQLAVPTYDRPNLRRAIVHLGVGGFHRAHQAVYLDELAGHRITTEWGERGVGLLPGDRRMAEALLPQDCLYTVVERAADLDTPRVIGSLLDYAFAPADPARVLDLLIDSDTRIISLTITEGGYLVDDTTGVFDADNPAVRADVTGATPGTVFGYVCAALRRRRDAGIPARSLGQLSSRSRVCVTTLWRTGSRPTWPSRTRWWTGSHPRRRTPRGRWSRRPSACETPGPS
jgi:mannitol 2-dehydrogenase